MEKAKTRSRAKAVPSAPTATGELDQPVLAPPLPPPPPSLPLPSFEATPAKKPRKTKKKKTEEEIPATAAAPPEPTIAASEVAQEDTAVAPSQQTETKKRGKRLKANEIVAQIEQQEHPEESAIVSMYMEESTKVEETPAKKVKKGGPGRKGRKKQPNATEEPPKTPAAPQPAVVEEPKPVVVEEAPVASPNKKKKRGRKPAATATASVEQKEEEKHIVADVIPALIEQPPVVNEPATNVVPESVTVDVAPLHSRSRTRTRTRTNTNPVVTSATTQKPGLNTTQDLPNKEPIQQSVDQAQPHSDVTKHSQEEGAHNSKTSVDESNNGQAKPKPGGARIVRPKETVTVVKTAVVENSTTEKVEVEKKVVEIVRREAGPRIVKPPEALIQEQLLAEKKRKLLEQNDHVNKVVKKLKEKADITAAKKAEKAEKLAAAAAAAASAIPTSVATNDTNEPKPESKKETAPDFKSIHQKETSKMESIVDFQKRLHKRHMTLNGTGTDAPITKTGGSTIPTSIRGGIVSSEAISAAKVRSPSHQPTTSRMPKPVVTIAKETPNKSNKAEPVVKMTKKLTMPSPLKVNNSNIINNVLAPQSSNIPVFVSSKQNKEAVKSTDAKSDAKTPKQQHVRRPKTSTVDNAENVMATMSKTPRNKAMNASSALAPKTPVNQSGKPASQDNLLRSASKNGGQASQGAGTIPPQLATSSFIRRKSFDLNASLSRRLAYKPYIGKLKPIEPPKPVSVVASNVLSTTRHNLNCTKN